MSGKQMLQALGVVAVLIFLVWLTFYVLIAALVIGGCVAAYFYIKRILQEKGIISASPEVQQTTNPSSDISASVIDVEYEEVEKPVVQQQSDPAFSDHASASGDLGKKPDDADT